jgi:hypothetical protein
MRRLQVGAGVGVDLQANSDFDDTRRFPSHGHSPLNWTSNDVGDPKTLSRLGRQIGCDHFDILVAQGD